MFAVSALLMGPGTPAAQDVPVDLELVLAVNVSGSIDDYEARLQRQGCIDALTDPAVLDAVTPGPFGRIAVTYVEWAGEHYQRTVLDWTVLGDAESAKAFVDRLSFEPLLSKRWTSISKAIDYAATLFTDNSYEGLRQVIDISGDNPNNRGRPVVQTRDAAVAAGITINGLPILNDRPNPWGGPPSRNLDIYYRDYVIGGPGTFMVVAEGFEDFGTAIRSKLIREIAWPPDAPDAPVRAAAAPPAASVGPAPRRSAGCGRIARSPGHRMPPTAATTLCLGGQVPDVVFKVQFQVLASAPSRPQTMRRKGDQSRLERSPRAGTQDQWSGDRQGDAVHADPSIERQ